jgi:prepilin-type N-terminal cleavage/methylation domain-containing protein
MTRSLTTQARRASHALRSRCGFSLIELMTVMAVIGLLAALSVPRYRDTKRRAFAANIAADFNTVRVAAYNYWADNNSYPPDGSPGTPPPALRPYLPRNFSFDNGSYTLDYDVWPSPLNPSQLVVGVTVTSDDQQLVNMVARIIAAGGLGINVGNGYTYIFAGL